MAKIYTWTDETPLGYLNDELENIDTTLTTHTHDHGTLTGLGDDDHTQYILANGTRAFSGTVGGVTPTAASHLTRKDYVDATDENEVFIPATALYRDTGAGSLIVINQRLAVQTLLDAENGRLQFTAAIPTSWRTKVGNVSAIAVFSGNTSSTNNWVGRMILGLKADGDSNSGDDFFDDESIAGPATAENLGFHTWSSSASLAGSDLLARGSILRIGGDASDTYAGIIYIAGIILKRS